MWTVEAYETQLALGTAIAVGLLIGLEREQSRPDGALFAGVRTYPIVALVGALATMLAPMIPALPLMAFAGVIVLVSISYARKAPEPGATTETSVIATYLLGALTTSRGIIAPMGDRLVLVAALGVTLTFLLSSKTWFHEIAARVSRADFFATVKFLIVAVIVLPLLPRDTVGPLDAISPFQIGLLTVMIAGLSFLGYVAMRWLGPDRGLFASAALGGLVSSTAVTMSFAARTRKDPTLAPVAAGAIGVAWTIMVIRIGVLVALVRPALLAHLAIPLAAMAAGCVIGIRVVFRPYTGATTADDQRFKNPFELGNAIRFAILFGVVLIVTKAAKQYLGDQGLFLAAGLSGATDVDATTLSTAHLPDVAALVASLAILLGAVSNTIVKTGLAFGFGGSALGRRVLLIATIMLGATAASLLSWL